MSRRDEILAKIKDIPELPTEAAKIAKLVRDPDFKMSELQQSIEYSPSLSANVLKMANSAYYAGPRSISSIREAIMRLGSDKIADLVMATGISSLTAKPVKGYQLSAGDLWEHMVTTAVATNHLADGLKIRLDNYAFTAALLHDIGKILLGSAIEVDAQPIMKLAFDEGLPFEQAERKILGIDHAEAGAALLESWNLPLELIEVVRWHHEPEKNERENTVLDLVHIANSLMMMSGMGRGEDGLNYKPSENITKKYGVKIKLMEKVIYQTMISKEELNSFFGGFAGR